MKRRDFVVIVALVALILGTSGSIVGAQQGSFLRDLRTLVDEEDEAFLLTEIERVQPYYSIRQLARFQQNQNCVGGGFCGCLPDQLMNVDEIPLPVDRAGVVETALYLARQRKANLIGLAELGFPVGVPMSLSVDIPPAERFPNIDVDIDVSVPSAFLKALVDGVVNMEEAGEIASMPANRELLRFIGDRRESGEPRLSEETLAYLIWKAGSRDPLDRLWSWLNPMNNFGYAGLSTDAAHYRELIEDLQTHRQDLADAAAARVASFLPKGTQMSVRFAFTPGCLGDAWMTPAMSGANALRIKGDWEVLVRKVSAGVFGQYLLQQVGCRRGIAPGTIVDAGGSELADEQSAVLHELIAYTVIEGTIDFVSRPSISMEEEQGVREGVALFHQCAMATDVEAARSCFELGRGEDGSLIALGCHLAGLVAERDGPRAVTVLLEHGCVDFFQRALEIDSEGDEVLLGQDLVQAVGGLSVRLGR